MSNDTEILRLMNDAYFDGPLTLPKGVRTKDQVVELARTATFPDGRRVVPLEVFQSRTVPLDGRLMQVDDMPPIALPRPRHDRAVAVIAVGAKPQAELEISRPLMQAYAAQYAADYIELTELPPVNHGCAYKYALSQIARNYDQTLLLDADVIVMPGAADVFAAVPEHSWGLVDDLENLRQSGCTDWLLKEFAAMADALGKPRLELTRAWNSGIVVAPRDAWREYYPPPAPVPATWCVEQNWHTYCLLESNSISPGRVIDLDMVWQAGFPWDSFPSAVLSAHFVHINGCHGPHEIRLAFLRHFASGQREITPDLRALFDGSTSPPWWILSGL